MKTDQQSLAHDLYFHTSKTQQEIADILDVHRQTVRTWIKKNRWDEMKDAARQMPALIQKSIYSHFNAVNDKIFDRDEAERAPSMEEVNKLQKLLNMAHSIKKQHTGAYLEAFQELQLFIFNRDSELATQLRDHIAAYTRGTLGDKEFMARKRRKDNVLEVTANLGREELRAEKDEHNAGVPHPKPVEGTSVATPPTQPISDYVETRCAASPLAQDDAQQMEPLCIQNVTLCNTIPPSSKTKTDEKTHEFCQLKNSDPLAQDDAQQMEPSCTENVAFCNNEKTEETPPFSQSGNSANSDQNVQFCIEDVQPTVTGSNTSKVFTVAANGEITPPQNSEKGNIQGNSENVTFPAEEACGIDDSKLFSKAMSIPPHMRPSPFIVGNTVWIVHPDHLENKYDTYGNTWGPRKMSHTIRYYPDIDPANNKAA